MKADAGTEAAVMSTLRKLFEGYESQDMDSVLSCHAPDPDLVAIGTGVDEKSLGLNEVRVWRAPISLIKGVASVFSTHR